MNAIKKEEFPLIPLRDLVLFPGFTVSLFIGRASSKNAVSQALKGNRKVFLCTQKDSNVQEPTEKDIHNIGVVAEILQMLKLPDGTLKILIEVQRRGQWNEYSQRAYSESNSPNQKYDEFKTDEIDPVSTTTIGEKSIINFDNNTFIKDESSVLKPEDGSNYINLSVQMIYSKEEPAVFDLKRRLLQQFHKYARTSTDITKDIVKDISQKKSAERVCDQVSGRINLPLEQKQKILQEARLKRRLELVIEGLVTLIGFQDIDKKIERNVQERISKIQKDYYLSEKIKEIRKEMGQEPYIYEETQQLLTTLKKKGLPKEAREKVLKEIDRLEKIPPMSAEITVLRNYIDWMLDLPWGDVSVDNTDLVHAQKILNRDHYALDEVKDRILDFIVVRRFVEKLKGPILCFVGPPGVGKTSLAKSIADALERQFVRMSLGGIKDEAEIRGHRKTYVGAMPGRIIQSMKKSKTSNPVFLLDEVDKLSSDFRGDPASALLEVLDPEQNWSFQDHYLEVNYDLSHVLFIATANALHKIPAPLRDRMEVIQIGGYSELEKLQIAKRFLLSKALIGNGLSPEQLKISNSHLYNIIRYYTKEAGVRNLDRTLNKVARKTLRKLAEKLDEKKGKDKPANKKNEISKESLLFNREFIKEFLGQEIFRFGQSGPTEEIGYCNGLAWTELGGDLLGIEVVLTDGKGHLQITGNVGQVMEESVKAAFTYIRSIQDLLGIDPVLFKKKDVHLHVPEGAIPKDGPSAGVTAATALVSAFTKIAIKKDVAMTGEITLRGEVLPVGGVKEKVLAAHRGQIKVIILPKENQKDLEDIPKFVKKRVKFYFVRSMLEIIPLALVSGNEKIAELNSLYSISPGTEKNIEQSIIQ